MKWPIQYRCAYCLGYGSDERPRAVFRAFAGVAKHGGGALGGGFPACGLHVGDALREAFATLNRPNPPDGWAVTGYRVTADPDDDPVMTRMWTATRPA